MRVLMVCAALVALAACGQSAARVEETAAAVSAPAVPLRIGSGADWATAPATERRDIVHSYMETRVRFEQQVAEELHRRPEPGPTPAEREAALAQCMDASAATPTGAASPVARLLMQCSGGVATGDDEPQATE